MRTNNFFKRSEGREKYLFLLLSLCVFITIGGFFFYYYQRKVDQISSSSQSFNLEALKKELETKNIKTRKVTEEDRWKTFSDEEIKKAVHFQEQWFEHEIIREK